MPHEYRTAPAVTTVTTAPTERRWLLGPRWGAIAAGVFVALAVLVLLGELGMAIGLTAFEPGDRAAAYAIGAGVWGVASAIVAFLAGGFVAGYASRFAPGRNAIGHGAMVWAVSVPVIGFLAAILAIGASAAAGTTAAAAAAATDADERVATRTDERTGEAVPVVREAAERATAPENVRKATKTAAATGWAMVLGLLLTLASAAGGGALARKAGDADLYATRDVSEAHFRTERAPD